MEKKKQFHFDVDLIIVHEEIQIMGSNIPISTFRSYRGIPLKSLLDLIKMNEISEHETLNITFHIKGVNY